MQVVSLKISRLADSQRRLVFLSVVEASFEAKFSMDEKVILFPLLRALVWVLYTRSLFRHIR